MEDRNLDRRLRSMTFLATALLTLVCTSACEKKEAPAPEPESTAVETASVSPSARNLRLAALSPDAPETAITGVPTSEDLEEEAAKTLSPDNLEAELDRLEAEITGD